RPLEPPCDLLEGQSVVLGERPDCVCQLDGLGVFTLDVLGEVDQRRFGVGETAHDVLDLEVRASTRLFEPEGSPHAAESAYNFQSTIREGTHKNRVNLTAGTLFAVTLTLLRHHVPS